MCVFVKNRIKENENEARTAATMSARIDKALISFQIKAHFIPFPNHFDGQKNNEIRHLHEYFIMKLAKSVHMRLYNVLHL